MWKTLWGACVHESTSGIRVYQNFLFRWLKFKGTTLQTLLNRYFPHRPGLYYVNSLTLFVRLSPGSCCMLGLGGAGVAHALSPFHQVKLTAVEYDGEVINIAKQFFRVNELSNLEIIHGDAQAFAMQTNKQFQHVLVDLFTHDVFPSQCNTEEFFYHCKRMLTTNGILAVNLANRSEQWPIFQLIRKNFHNSTLAVSVKKSANIIIFATKHKSANYLIDVLKQHKQLKNLFWDEKWGCVAELKH
ncbi:spermidine synthase [Legionella clemsonensis]|uniref:Spermidine synthase n=1 Tax=Legionella clemsonensis TaxID=1867846 RepID=A0A222P2L6_9GAMM|nr:fused MFS/spermidine synthase [Legionella clemsonensis]ASQ46083.1 spermidine synthase [Legionella clemsonensis]